MEMHEKIRSGRLRLGESEEVFGRRFGVTRATVQQWEKPGGTAPKLERITEVADALGLTLDEMIAGRGHDGLCFSSENVAIPQYNTGGKMGNGLVLRDQPGIIKSWSVSPEWLRLNVPNCTNPNNLAIVTGFGDSMRGMFNPGDPLIVDTGVRTVEIDAVFFFRVGKEGYIKRLQRIPTINGTILRAKSEDAAYDPFDIVEGMDFEVFGRILKAWKSSDY